MAEYIITPEKNDLPQAPFLIEELHRRGLPVEITVKGTTEKWTGIQFVEPGPPEIKCSLALNSEKGLSVTIPTNSPHQALELQLHLVDILLQQVGGRADNTETRERYNPRQFASKMKTLVGYSGEQGDLFWLFFSWIVFTFSVLLYFSLAKFRSWDLLVVVLSLAGAGGLTYLKLKS
jgi:hypothetical protein